MKTADEMFRELGYVKNDTVSDEEDGTICYSNNSSKVYIIVNPYLSGGGLVEGKLNKKTVGLTVKELRAVAKLLDEMGV